MARARSREALKRTSGATGAARGEIVTEKPVDLDAHRGMVARKDTEIRRDLREVQVNQAALRARREELEAFLFAAPAATWFEASAKARYLIELFAATPDAQDPRQKKLIASALADFARLSAAEPAVAEPLEAPV